MCLNGFFFLEDDMERDMGSKGGSWVVLFLFFGVREDDFCVNVEGYDFGLLLGSFIVFLVFEFLVCLEFGECFVKKRLCLDGS